MKNLTTTLLLTAAGSYSLFRSYQNFRHPSPYSSWFAPYGSIVLAGLAFLYSFKSYRRKESGESPSEAPEPLTRAERITFKALGVPVVLVGLALVGVSGWLAWGQWVKVTRWPRTDAILISKDISRMGARLVFRYHANGHRITALRYRWGSEQTERKALETYEPGTVPKISYDPEDPAQVETILNFSWELFMAPIFGAVFGTCLLASGVEVYRWSYSRFTADLN